MPGATASSPNLTDDHPPRLTPTDISQFVRLEQCERFLRFQGGERAVILVSATESDRAYLLASSDFMLDPRRLTVALSRAKRKMILVASRSIFSVFSPDEEVFQNSQLWKNLLLKTCTTSLWEGERGGRSVAVWGGRGDVG